MPVCVGIAPTRTLAKLPNYAAKHYPATGGVVDLTDSARQRRLVARVPVDEVWGVGGKLSAKLQAMGIETALNLADADPATLRRRFSVVLERTVRELRGIACLAGTMPHRQKNKSCAHAALANPSRRYPIWRRPLVITRQGPRKNCVRVDCTPGVDGLYSNQSLPGIYSPIFQKRICQAGYAHTGLPGDYPPGHDATQIAL